MTALEYVRLNIIYTYWDFSHTQPFKGLVLQFLPIENNAEKGTVVFYEKARPGNSVRRQYSLEFKPAIKNGLVVIYINVRGYGIFEFTANSSLTLNSSEIKPTTINGKGYERFPH